MSKPTKTACAREEHIESNPFTGDIKQAILAGLNAAPGGILGLLEGPPRRTPGLPDGRAGTRNISRRRVSSWRKRKRARMSERLSSDRGVTHTETSAHPSPIVTLAAAPLAIVTYVGVCWA